MSLKEVLSAHDRKITETGLEIWLGAEPTFADRLSTDPQWQTSALGADKEKKARAFVAEVFAHSPGSVILRTLGRQYPGENKPRWNLGVYSRRDSTAIWSAPLDPIAAQEPQGSAADLSEQAASLKAALGRELQTAGMHCCLELPKRTWGQRLLFAGNAALLDEDWRANPLVIRPPVQTQPIPSSGTEDELAASGVFLIAIGPCETPFSEDRNSLQLELPAFDRVDRWIEFLSILRQAANKIGLSRLVLTGYPPPVDETVSWTTVTPDPGVIEINMAPCANVSDFYPVQQQLHHAARSIGLSSYKLLFNGEVIDSGGGQHLTFGGPTPDSSPFFKVPRLLPRLVSYLNRHPSLSYWFAVRSVGSCGQQPRADEVSPESLDGLAVALDRLSQNEKIDPEQLWRSLAQYLCDRFGNTHRCEINVEKLWNAHCPGRGCLGLVELRAFRMTRSPEHAAAIAVLMRTLIAWLATRRDNLELIDWGPRLHDRFALPFYLIRDLDEVLAELTASGFGLDKTLESLLREDSLIVIGTHDFGRARLTIRQAIEFWPVVGDSSGTERSFRMMDSSTQRIEIMLELRDAKENAAPEANWRLSILGHDVPWAHESGADGTVLLRGVRYKAFHPQTTVSPLVHVIDPLEFFLAEPTGNRAWKVRLFNWQPDRLAYDGMPADFDAADRRRRERLVINEVETLPDYRPMPRTAVSEHCVDLRRIG